MDELTTTSSADDRRAQEVRLSDATVHFLEQRIAAGVLTLAAIFALGLIEWIKGAVR